MRGNRNGMKNWLKRGLTGNRRFELWSGAVAEELPVSVAHRHFFWVVDLTLLENSFTQLLLPVLLTAGGKCFSGESLNSKC